MRIALSRLLAVALSLAGLSALPASIAAAPPAAAPAVNGWGIPLTDVTADPAIRFGTLPNGMKYAIMRNATPKGSASLRLHFSFGSLAEGEKERGLAHFIEHMVFNGTTHVEEGEYIKTLERLGLKFGPDTNAFTGFDSTIYVLDLPQTDAERLDKAMFLLREVASEVTFDPASVERERGVILGERRARESYQFHQQIDRLRFDLPLAPYANRLPIGTAQVIKTATADDLRSLYLRYYRPERATLVFVGDADPDAIEARIRSAFAGWQGAGPAGAPLPRGRVDFNRPTGIDTFFNRHVPTSVALTIMRPWRDPPDTRAERRLALVRSIGTSMLTKRIAKLINQSDSVLLGGGATTGGWEDAALISSIHITAKDGAWREAVTVAEQELRRAQIHGFTAPELKRELANVAAARRQAAEQAATRRSDALASVIVSTIDDDGFVTTPAWRLDEFNAVAPTISLEEVNAAFRGEWAGSAPLIHVSDKRPIAPKAIADALITSRKMAVAALANDNAATFAYESFGPAGRVVEDRRIEDLGIRTVRFANNVRLNIKRTDFEQGRVRYTVRLAGGQLLMPRDKPGLSMMLNMVSAVSGTGRHSLEDIKELLAGRIVQAGFSVGTDAFVSAGATNPEDLAVQMKLSAAYLTDPGFRPEASSRWANAVPTLDKQINSQPASVLEAKWPLALMADGRFGVPGAPILLQRNVGEARLLLALAGTNAPIEIGIVGDIDEDKAIAAVAQSFGALPNRAEALPIPSDARNVRLRDDQRSMVMVHGGPADQAIVAALWPTDDDRDYRRAIGMVVLASVLQLELTDTVREQLGATYGINVESTMSDTFPGLGTLTVSAVVSPTQAAAVEQAIAAGVASLRDKPISADLLARARNPLMERVTHDLRENGYWMSFVARAQGQADRLERIRRRKAIYESLSPAELQRLARTYLTDDKVRTVRVISSNAPAKFKPPATAARSN